MHCKNYRAYTMAEAMAAVKADLGPDAIVLHTRTLTQGGFLGIGRKTVIEVTAARAEPTRDEPRRGASERNALGVGSETDGAGHRLSARTGAASRAYGSVSSPGQQTRRESASEATGKADPSADASMLDRDRTRLLAQAMAVKLEREREMAPRTSAVNAASANAAATSMAAQRGLAGTNRASEARVPSTTEGTVGVRSGVHAPLANGSSPVQPQQAAPLSATMSATLSGPLSAPGVAQRFVLVPANAVQSRSAPSPSPSASPSAAPIAAPQPAERVSVAQRVVPASGISVGGVPTGTPASSSVVESVAAPRLPIASAAPAPTTVARAQAPASEALSPAAAAGLARAGVEPIDLVDMNRLVDEVLRRPPIASRQAGRSQRPERLEALYANLIAQEIGNDLADAITTDLHASLTPEELASDHAVRSAAMQRIAALLPSGGGLEPVPGAQGWRRDGRALCVAFVGPTGVGKTTTVAKIAASLKLRHAARVGLITCDTYRIAAVDQLRTYAEIIGLPLEVVLSPGQMRQARQRLNDLDVILIDTAGRSQNDADRIGELAAMVKAAEPHETHLVLASVASEKVLLREAQAFATVGVQRVVLTKLDEAAGLGAVVRVLRQIGRGVSYVTTGQEVPQHLESARPSRLAELVLSGGGGTISA